MQWNQLDHKELDDVGHEQERMCQHHQDDGVEIIWKTKR